MKFPHGLFRRGHPVLLEDDLVVGFAEKGGVDLTASCTHRCLHKIGKKP